MLYCTLSSKFPSLKTLTLMIQKQFFLFSFIFSSIIFYSCKNENLENSKTKPKSEIDRKYIEYLNGYFPNGLGSFGEKVEIKRFSEKTFWITFDFGSGIKQEIYWLLEQNKLIPKFEFEFGGMNWESELNYTFINIDKKDTITGNVYGSESENQIERLKEKFVNSNK